MASVPCPQKDNGICNIPDPAVVISHGEFSLIRAKTVRRLYPDLNLRVAHRVHLASTINYNELVLHVAKSLTPQTAIAGETDFDEVESYESAHLLETVSAAVGSRNGVIVNCSCGHVFTV